MYYLYQYISVSKNINHTNLIKYKLKKKYIKYYYPDNNIKIHYNEYNTKKLIISDHKIAYDKKICLKRKTENLVEYLKWGKGLYYNYKVIFDGSFIIDQKILDLIYRNVLIRPNTGEYTANELDISCTEVQLPIKLNKYNHQRGTLYIKEYFETDFGDLFCLLIKINPGIEVLKKLINDIDTDTLIFIMSPLHGFKIGDYRQLIPFFKKSIWNTSPTLFISFKTPPEHPKLKFKQMTKEIFFYYYKSFSKCRQFYKKISKNSRNNTFIVVNAKGLDFYKFN